MMTRVSKKFSPDPVIFGFRAFRWLPDTSVGFPDCSVMIMKLAIEINCFS